MAQRVQLKSYDVTRGINRTFSQLELPEGYVADALDVLPRIPGGVQAINGDTVLTGALATELNDLFPYYTPSGGFYWVGRSIEAFYYSSDGATWNTLAGVSTTAISGGLHSMYLYRGQLAIAEEGRTIKLWDGTTVTTLTSSPVGGLVCEFAGRLCNLGESSAPSFPTIKIPLVGTGVPLAAISKLTSGSGTIASNVVTPDPAPAWTIDAYKGKPVVLGGAALYRVASNTATTFTVTAIDTMPADSASAVPFEIYSGDFLEVYPSGTIDLGQSAMGADSGACTARFHNRSPIPVRVVAIRVKGKDFRVEDLPALPATVPPGGTIAFKIVMNPFSVGTVTGNVIIEHDQFAQSSLSIALTGEGVQSAILASPSVVDFGEWIIGTTSAPLSVQIKNTLREDITLPLANWVSPSSPFSITGAPAADRVIHPDETFTFTLTFTPATAGTATSSVQSARTMAAHRARLRFSQPLDPTKWNHDEDWLDVDKQDSLTGNPVALCGYDDSLIVFKESEIGAVTLGGPFDFQYSELTLGKGIGAVCQQAVTWGDGSMYWVAKTGVYEATGRSIRPLHQPIEDVVKAVAASDYAKVRACFYDHHLIWTAPLPAGFIDADVAKNKRFWAYHLPTDSWWPLSGTAAGMAVKRGTSDKPAWYVSTGATFAQKDADLDALTAFMLKPGYISGGEPGIIKYLQAVELRTDLPSQFATGGILVVTDNGNTVKGVPSYPAKVTLSCGIGTASGGVLTDTSQAWTVDAFVTDDVNGKPFRLVVNGSEYSITGNSATTITYGGGDSGLVSYSVIGLNQAQAVPVMCWLRECFGTAFQLSISGARTATSKGNIHGFNLHIIPMGAYSGQPGRV